MPRAQCFLSHSALRDGQRAVALLLARVPGTSEVAIGAAGAIGPADRWTPICPPLHGVVADALRFSPDPSAWATLLFDRLRQGARDLPAGPNRRRQPALVADEIVDIGHALRTLAADRLFLRLPEGHAHGRHGTPDSVPVAWALADEGAYLALTEMFWLPKDRAEAQKLPYDPHVLPEEGEVPLTVSTLAQRPSTTLPFLAWASPLHRGTSTLLSPASAHDSTWAVAELLAACLPEDDALSVAPIEDATTGTEDARAQAFSTTAHHRSPLWLVEKAAGGTLETRAEMDDAFDPGRWALQRPLVEDLLRFSVLGEAMAHSGTAFGPGMVVDDGPPRAYALHMAALRG